MLPIAHPHPVIGNPQTVRPSGVLALLSGWDAAPTELAIAGYDYLTIYATFTRGGGAGGAVDIQAQGSPYAIDLLGVENWFPQSLLVAAGMVPGADLQSRNQREYVTYQATAAGIENFVVGVLRVAAVERIRVRCRESGTPLAPGTVHLVAVGNMDGSRP
jgi:hypothetical protein